MSLFKKPNRKYRQRAAHNDSDEEDHHSKLEKEKNDQKPFGSTPGVGHGPGPGPGPGSIKPVSVGINIEEDEEEEDVKEVDVYSRKSIGKKKEKKEKSENPKLSFHDDEDEADDAFTVKKSSFSRRMARKKEKEKKKQEREEREKEREKRATLSENGESIRKKMQREKEKEQEELNVIWVKSDAMKAKEEENLKILEPQEVVDLEEEEEEDEEDRLANDAHPFRGALERGVIPDAKTIYALKKQRQLARDASDFIPVDKDVKYEDNAKSRLIRDDDNDKEPGDDDDDDDEDDERISFAVNKEALEKEKAREAFLQAQEEEEEKEENEDKDSEDEFERWEVEQIRKGVGAQNQPQYVLQTQMGAQFEEKAGSPRFYPARNPIILTAKVSKEKKKKATAIPAHLSRPKSELTPEMIYDELMDHYNRKLESLDTLERKMVSLGVDSEQTEDDISTLEEDSAKLGYAFVFYQDMSGYVSTLVECLNEKIPLIEELEARSLKLFKSKMDRLILRRQQDVRDQNDECMILSKRILSYGLGMVNDMSWFDYGGDNLKRQRATEREGRRMRRRKIREKDPAIGLSLSKHYDGLSSDDEEADSYLRDFEEELQKLSDDASNIFEDVLQDFSCFKDVVTRFETWKTQQTGSYSDAYVSLCLPKIFGPFIRLELLNWNPFDEKCSQTDVEDMPWFETLLFFGAKEKQDNLQIADDPDLNLIPTLIERVVLPRLTDLVDNVWDPMSTRHTLQLIRLLSKWTTDYPTISNSSKKLHILLQKVALRISRSLDEDIFIPQLLPKEVLENRQNPVAMIAVCFYQRQFWAGVKLMRNIISWQGIVADLVLQELALEKLLNRYLVLTIQRTLSYPDTLEKCKMIVSSLPRSWSFQGKNSFPQLESMSNLLNHVYDRNASDSNTRLEITRLQAMFGEEPN